MTSEKIGIEFGTELEKKKEIVNQVLRKLLSEKTGVEPRLRQAMEYTLHSPGKRLRAALVLWCSELTCGEINPHAKAAAAAIEMVHAYSLVHDDLPAMDDDDFRRGTATCHKAFDEATAILTGDALLTLAFEVIADQVRNPQVAVKMIETLAKAAGPEGMIAGQMADLLAENARPDLQILQYIHENKTAKMFSAAAQLGALAGNADENQLKLLGEYGLKIGLGFQIADDILDVCGSTENIGKTAGKDEKAGKMTYPALLGLEKSRQLEEQLANQAIDTLNSFGQQAKILHQLALALLGHKK
jgi:geranylgeranyl pyrophosphate synthase